MATTTPRVVIIGAGIVGCALADELSRRGHSRVTVVDQGPLFRTGGSTSHDPGLVLRTTGGRTTTRLASATVAKYTRLSDGGVPAFRAVGGLEVATTPERLADLRRRRGRAAAAGIRAEMLEPGECAALHPLVDRAAILGGLHTPSDGVVDPLVAAAAQARAATGRGVRFLGHHRVTAVERAGDRVRGVWCDDEFVPADVVVSCAGVWGPLVGRLAGVDIPLVSVVHQYARTSAVRELDQVHALERASGRRDPLLPVLRHVDAGLSVRDHGDRLGIGALGHRAVPMDPGGLDRPDPGTTTPAGRRFTPDDFDPSWEAAAALLPCLGDAKVEEGLDGVSSATPDGLPLLGESPALSGFWAVEAVSVAHSAGAAEAVAEWIVTGRPSVGGEPIDLSTADLDRFDDAELAPAVVRGRACAAVHADIPHPYDPQVAARPVRTTPVHSREVELRAVFADDGGWERPLWFGANAMLPEVCEVAPRRGWAAREWSPIAAAEALVTRRAAGLFDLTPQRRVEVTGPRALAFLQRLTTNDLDRPVGHVVPALMLDAGGGVLADLTVARLAPQRFLLGPVDRRALAVLRRFVRDGVTVTDRTADTCCLGVWGPAVPAFLDGPAPRTDPLRAVEFELGGIPVTGLRVSCVGEYGWELTTSAEHGEHLWDVLYTSGARHGLVAAGRHALDSLRMEKGHRVPGADVTTEHGPDATGLGSAVSMDAGPFVGRAAVHRARTEAPPEKQLVTLVLDHAGAVLDGGEAVLDVPEARRYTRGPVLVDDAPPLPCPVIGYVSSAAVGYTVGKSIAHAWLPAARASAGTRVEVETNGRRLGAEVVDGPLYDPSTTRTTGDRSAAPAR